VCFAGKEEREPKNTQDTDAAFETQHWSGGGGGGDREICRGKVNRSRKHEEDITVSGNCDVMQLKCQNKTKYMELR
jgi:hypothetical protein